jgi:hypothetical protein
MRWLILALVLAVIVVPSVVLIRRSRASIGGVGPAQEHAPRNVEREVLERRRDFDGTGGSNASGAP